MSALYAALRTRLPEVGRRYEWVELGSEAMRDARKGKGLSYEGVARMLGYSAKQYERWERAGEVPVHMVIRVATALGLEVEMPQSVARIILPEAPLSDEESRSLEILRRLARIEDRLGIPPDGQGDAPPPPGANGHE